MAATTMKSRDYLWNEVEQFLTSMKFEEYISNFKSEGFDRMDAIYDINMDDLRDMNVKKGHAKILLAQINLIKAKNGNTDNNNNINIPSSIGSNLPSIDELTHHSPDTDDNNDYQSPITPNKSHPLSGYNSSGSSQTNLSSISHSVKHYSNINPRDRNLHTPTLNPSQRSLIRSV